MTTLPWYRQFWPWFIIALPASVVIASIFTVRLAFQFADTTVRDDYYHDGLAINQSFARERLAQELAIGGEIELTGERVIIHLNRSDTTNLEITFSHPFNATKDQHFQLSATADPRVFQVETSLPPERWYIDLEGRQEGTVTEAWLIQIEHNFFDSSQLVFGVH